MMLAFVPGKRRAAGEFSFPLSNRSLYLWGDTPLNGSNETFPVFPRPRPQLSPREDQSHSSSDKARGRLVFLCPKPRCAWRRDDTEKPSHTWTRPKRAMPLRAASLIADISACLILPNSSKSITFDSFMLLLPVSFKSSRHIFCASLSAKSASDRCAPCTNDRARRP